MKRPEDILSTKTDAQSQGHGARPSKQRYGVALLEITAFSFMNIENL
jgi:hypothetical protein